MKAIGLGVLAACVTVAADAQTMLTLHENQAGAICYRAELGAPFQVSLPAQAGTGYAWSMRSGDGLEPVGEPVIGVPRGGGMIVGGPQIQTLRFRATTPGRHTLTLALARSWEKGAGPVRLVSFCLQTPER